MTADFVFASQLPEKANFVVDCSVVATWFLEDEKTTLSEKLLKRIIDGEKAIAPSLLQYELANVFAMAQRRGRLTKQTLRPAVQFFELLKIIFDHTAESQTFHTTQLYAEKYQLTIYDASYLELAIRKDIPLATFDKALMQAAKKESVILL